MMQEFDEQLFNSIEKFLKGDQNCDLLSGIQNIELKRKVRNKYPILMKTLEAAADTGGNLEESFRYNNDSLLLRTQFNHDFRNSQF